ncbi:MAG TPA: DNA replication and repair protein RecF [Solirubrobacteraceae bacterium]|nr:DNA replication and repair protein RecF [Solirubrobacteraceae bacterium]
MRVRVLTLRDFRNYERAEIAFGDSLTVVTGSNGAGKTNLLEALYFGCTGRSCRTANEREVVRFGAGTTRITLTVESDDGAHELGVGFEPGQPKRMQLDGASVERLLDLDQRPLVSVFLPDRLELVKGPPAVRRAHLDQFIGAMWPSRVATRRAYSQALQQRNALIARVRAGHGSPASLATWNLQLAQHGIALMGDRDRAVQELSEPFGHLAEELGLDGGASVAYRPRSKATTAEALADELAERTPSDLERGFSGHGPHRDELALLRSGRELRVYGSQGQQRLALLALLLAERERIATHRRSPPLMLLDDVMSELDQLRRQALVELLRGVEGQSVISTTDLEHVPGGSDPGITRLAVSDGEVRIEELAR